MREIKFRGMHIHVLPDNEHLNGKWVYGYLSAKNYINTGENEILIDEDTIGQFTGLHDKNGKEIYEGDVVEFTDMITINASKTHRAVVEWTEEFGGFHIPADAIGYYAVCKNQIDLYDMRVIGNIYENPEKNLERRKKDADGT